MAALMTGVLVVVPVVLCFLYLFLYLCACLCVGCCCRCCCCQHVHVMMAWRVFSLFDECDGDDDSDDKQVVGAV